MTKAELQAKCDATRLKNLLARKNAKRPLTAADSATLIKLLATQPIGDPLKC